MHNLSISKKAHSIKVTSPILDGGILAFSFGYFNPSMYYYDFVVNAGSFHNYNSSSYVVDKYSKLVNLPYSVFIVPPNFYGYHAAFIMSAYA